MLNLFRANALAGPVDLEKRTVKGTVSSNRVDSYGTIILPEGIDLARYQKNPLFLWSHDRWSFPIGKCLDINRTTNGLDAVFEFAPADANEDAEKVLQLYAGGYLKGFSIGGRIREAVWSYQPESEWGELPDYAVKAMREKTCRGVIKRIELFEISACTTPANPEALARAVAEGLITEEWLARHAAMERTEEVLAPLAAMLERMESLLGALEKRLAVPSDATSATATDTTSERNDATPEEPAQEPEIALTAEDMAGLARDIAAALFGAK